MAASSDRPEMTAQIRERFAEIAARLPFDRADWWLTFYLDGDPAKLEVMAARLGDMGAVNLSGAESAFLYPKLKVPKQVEAVLQCAQEVAELCAECGVTILNIDADTSPEVVKSDFATLYDAP